MGNKGSRVKGKWLCSGTHQGGRRIGDSTFKKRQRREGSFFLFTARSQGRGWREAPGEGSGNTWLNRRTKQFRKTARGPKQSQSKAMKVNRFAANEIRLERQERSHGGHRPWLQSCTAILSGFSHRLPPMTRPSIFPIRGAGMEGRLSGGPKSGYGDLYGYRYGRTEKINQGVVANFPRPGDRTRVANKGDISKCVRFRAFLLVQIWTKSCKSVQNRAKTCQKTTEKTGFLRLNSFKTMSSPDRVKL